MRQRPDAPVAPGDLIQVDTMFVSGADGNRLAVLNAVDVVSRQAWSLTASSASSGAAERLLDQIRRDIRPRRLQVDGGSEFRGDFERACARMHIPLHGLPPRSPKLNAQVESFNDTLRRELFNFHLDIPGRVEPLDQLLWGGPLGLDGVVRVRATI